MKDNFEQCLEWLLHHEGGYVDHKHDPGGATNLGVTHKVWASWKGVDSVTKDEMKTLTVADVTPLYKARYWDKNKCDDLPSGVDWMCFDWGVNSGTGRSGKALQRAVGATVDGVVGPNTLKAVSGHRAARIVESIYQERQAFYESLRNFKHFGRGWTRRNKETYQQAQGLL